MDNCVTFVIQIIDWTKFRSFVLGDWIQLWLQLCLSLMFGLCPGYCFIFGCRFGFASNYRTWEEIVLCICHGQFKPRHVIFPKEVDNFLLLGIMLFLHGNGTSLHPTWPQLPIEYQIWRWWDPIWPKILVRATRGIIVDVGITQRHNHVSIGPSSDLQRSNYKSGCHG